jgi:zinc transporter 1/2/3
MGLIHILPESAKMLEELSDIPIAYILCFLSYALILFVEKVAFNSHSLLHSHIHSQENLQNRENYQNDNRHNSEDELRENDDSSFNEIKPKENEENNEKIYEVKVSQTKEASSEINVKDLGKKQIIENDTTKKGSLTAYILLFALGFHGLFEGISLGIQSTIRQILFLFLAISLHKWAASLSLGISFVKSGIKRKQFIIMSLIFSFISPLGVIIGMALSFLSSDILAGIFLSISVGTFIYIACSEIIIDEFADGKYKCYKYMFFLLGAAIVIALSLVEVFSDVSHR